MTRLERSEVLQRIIRKDDSLAELAVPTWDLLASAIKSQSTQEALDLLEYARDESRRFNDGMVDSTDTFETYIASFGEEYIEKYWREINYAMAKERPATPPSVEETLESCIEVQRSHHGNLLSIVEEPDRYVVTYDPCGSGGRLRRTKSVGTTKKAYPWSWSKSGVCYHCCHCCINREIIPIELYGYPTRINIVGDRPEDPCIHLFYKKPELIPEEYFTRVGKTKTIR